jgi:hypothetical protein
MLRVLVAPEQMPTLQATPAVVAEAPAGQQEQEAPVLPPARRWVVAEEVEMLEAPAVNLRQAQPALTQARAE